MPRSYEGHDSTGNGGSNPTSPNLRHVRQLPAWRVVLRDEDDNDRDYVIETLLALTPLSRQEVALRVDEVARDGESLLFTAHRERAELYERQLGKRNLYVTIDPA